MSEARAILQKLIDDFSPEKFVRFFREKNRHFTAQEIDYSRYNDNDFKNGFKLGEIKLQDGDSLLICSFQVRKPLSEKAGKRAQYEKAKSILKATENQIHSAAIFIFYDTDGNFRFSLVYPEAIGTKRQWNNFRRFTYFVSKEFTNKTFLKQIGDKSFEKLNDIKAAFSITAVTDIFYDEFFKLYDKLVQETQSLNKIKKEEDARDFVLLFAIRTVFLGFIQKRKWLGDDEKFIQHFYQEYKETSFGKNIFYSQWLEPLFFEALNSPQGNKVVSKNAVFSQKSEAALQTAPYLNGGLFKKKPGYDTHGWLIQDKVIGEFFDFLFSHSFTIEENSLTDEDLQLNPEFLGIIFERLVNKADGAVYTPRTEVDIMCRLSLVKWLEKNLESKIKRDNLYELFFREGEKEEDQKHGSFSKREAEEILLKLEGLSICDPAVGSGAFVVGMMQVLDEVEQRLKERYGLNGRSVFERKKEIIKNSLYGVEVKEWAVWICQLRLWLSLFVDAPDEIKNSLDPILPSLDFKIRQGDSLVQRIGGKAFPVTGHNHEITGSVRARINELKELKLQYFDNKGVFHEWDELREREIGIYDEMIKAEIAERETDLRDLKDKKHPRTLSLFEEEKEIKQLPLELNKDKILALEKEIDELRAQRRLIREEKPLVWGIEFADVFGEKGGFDIIIGNPPYVRQEDIADPTGKIKDKKEYKTCLQEMVRIDFPEVFSKKAKINAQSDLYTYFYIRGLRLLNPQGIHTFICSNSWLDVGYGIWLQEFLLKCCPVELIIDNHAKRSFGGADVNTIISIIHAPQARVYENHSVKFVAFKKPFEESIYTEYLLQIADAKKIESNDVFRVYPLTTKELEETGTEYENEEQKILGGKYVGDKWGGKFLRAPDIFFTILEKGKEHIDTFDKYFTGERYLNTGGADGFFILTNATQKNNGFFLVDNDKTLQKKTDFFSGDIETGYLKPLIKDQTKKDKRIQIRKTDAWCLVVDSDIKKKKVESYIKWGEKQGYHQRSVTISQKPWYKPTNQMKQGAEILLPRSFNDTFVAYYNPEKFLSLRFYRLHAKQKNIEELISYMNSTLFWFVFEALGNKSQGQGVLDFFMEQFLITKMPIILSKEYIQGFNKLKNRPVNSIFEECGIDPKSNVVIEDQEPKPLPDRAELDKIVFDALGLTQDERKEVYRAVCRLVWNRISKAQSV